MQMTSLRLVSVGLALLSLAACTFRGTTAEISDTTHNTTISTSGRSWFTEDGLVRQGEQVNAFAALNIENLRQDMACASGEYLASLGTLMGVPYDQQPVFFQLAQAQFQAGRWHDVTPAELVAGLNRAVVAHGIRTGS